MVVLHTTHTNMLAKAISITAQAFENTLDKGGYPYMLHCLRVWDGVKHLSEDVQCAAIMHDLKEDAPEVWEKHMLLFSSKTRSLVNTLTHYPTETYDNYIKMISLSKDATKIKLSDLKDNSDITRLKGLTKKDFDRLEKYSRSYVYLSKI